MHDGARARALTWLATVGIGFSILIMIALSLLRDGWQRPPIVLPALGPPWDLPTTHVSLGTASVALWIAVAAGTGGVIAGLAAIGHGARPSPRCLLIIAGIVVAVLTVLPPTGSTDAFDYAAYGRIVVLGHSPYLLTPYHLRRVHDALAGSVPVSWQHMVSVYGPLATVEQFLAAKLGGVSAARITFWLKLWNSAAFALVALVADRLLRADPARRLRAHLLWTLNPLLLWDVIAAGHLDVLAAAAGLLGLLVLRWQPEAGPPPLPRVLASGALIGVAADIKANYALFGLGVIWALRRRPASLAGAACAALAAAVPGYAWFGTPAVHAIASRRNQASAGSFYDLLPVPQSYLALIAAALIIAVALLALRRMPAGIPDLPAVRPALAASTAWLLLWPYQYPWYATMIICLLILYPASRLDWVVLAPVAVGTVTAPLGIAQAQLGRAADLIHELSVNVLSPLVLLAAAAGLVALCLSGRWNPGEPDPGPTPEPTRPVSPRTAA
jgi:alpha-1,6-mannosyltransferase